MALNRLAFHIVILVLSFINVVSHTLGICLVSKLYSQNKSAQQLMIINLSVAELINSFIRAIIIIIHMLPPPYMPKFIPGVPPGPPTDAQLASTYLLILTMTGMFFIVFLIMMALMLDRLLVVVLKSKYNSVCSIFNTKILLGFIWGVGVVMFLAFPLSYHIHGYKHNYHFEYHIYLTTDVVFIVFAVLSYVCVFMMYRGYAIAVEGSEAESNSRSSFLRALLDPYFHIPLLIIFTYFIFIILPHWVYVGKKYAEGSRSMDHLATAMIMMLLGYWSDAIVYIFMQPSVRKLLWRWLRCKKGIASDVSPPVNSTNTEI